jgi:toxin ParE1/3/4
MPLLRLATSRETDADLADILEHSSRAWGMSQARRYLSSLRASFRRLREYPQLGFDRSDLYPGMRCAASQEHHIYYIVREDHIYIVRVLHEREDAEAELNTVNVD